MNQFIDVIMHLLFLGVTKLTMQLTTRWIPLVLRPKQFNLKYETIFGPIIVIGLYWRKLIDTYAGCVSDN